MVLVAYTRQIQTRQLHALSPHEKRAQCALCTDAQCARSQHNKVDHSQLYIIKSFKWRAVKQMRWRFPVRSHNTHSGARNQNVECVSHMCWCCSFFPNKLPWLPSQPSSSIASPHPQRHFMSLHHAPILLHGYRVARYVFVVRPSPQHQLIFMLLFLLLLTRAQHTYACAAAAATSSPRHLRNASEHTREIEMQQKDCISCMHITHTHTQKRNPRGTSASELLTILFVESVCLPSYISFTPSVFRNDDTDTAGSCETRRTGRFVGGAR